MKLYCPKHGECECKKCWQESLWKPCGHFWLLDCNCNNKKENKMKKPVLVTTEFRGVFFGYVKNDNKCPSEITLTECRNCIFWSSSIGGFLGLASKGPNSICKIGEQINEITLYKITSITNVEEKAVEAWKKA